MSPSSENSDESSHNNGSIIDNAYDDVHGDDRHDGDNDNQNDKDNDNKMAGCTPMIASPGATNMETAKHGTILPILELMKMLIWRSPTTVMISKTKM